MTRQQVAMSYAVDAIQVGHRHRQDLGDLDELAASVRDVGLLEPISVTPSGVLVTGLRRLEVLRRLGVRTTPVWITEGVSSRLAELLAEQHENLYRKELTATEQAALWVELKELYAQVATRGRPRKDALDEENPGDSHDFSDGEDHRSRVRAARVITGRDSSQRLARVDEVARLAADETLPAGLRAELRAQLEQMDATGKVHGPYQRARDLLDAHRQALAHEPDGEIATSGSVPHQGWREVDGPLRARLALRRLAQACAELDGWWELADAERLLADVDAQQVEHVIHFLRHSLDYLTAEASPAAHGLACVPID